VVWAVTGVGDLWVILCADRNCDGDYESAEQSLLGLSVGLWHRVPR